VALSIHLARKGPRREGQRLSFGIGLIGKIWIGGSGESMGKTGIFMGKGFNKGVVGESFGW
jgi:hypothetical protein